MSQGWSVTRPGGKPSSFNEATKAAKSWLYRTLARGVMGPDTEEDMLSSGGSDAVSGGWGWWHQKTVWERLRVGREEGLYFIKQEGVLAWWWE